MSRLLKVSNSPHIHAKDSTKKMMYNVIIALIPALIAAVYYFGWGAIIVTLTSVLSCVIFEYLIQKYLIRGPVTITDGSAIVTGLLLAFNVPSNLPVLLIIIGALVAIGVGKMSFGGLGNNPFNPALVARVFLLISFPVQMTTWPVPSGFNTGASNEVIESSIVSIEKERPGMQRKGNKDKEIDTTARVTTADGQPQKQGKGYTDVVTGATPLGTLKQGLRNGENISQIMEQVPSHMQMFYGYKGGSMGEVAALALLIGFAYLLIKKVITWHIPVAVIGTVVIFTTILWLVNPEKNADPLFHILTGGILLGAIFMATDYVTSPMVPAAMILYGIGIGVITILIRVFGAYPEGVSFAILIMNAFVPLMNAYIKPKRFGEEVKHGKD
ncbi:MAG: RnfABCDGE type electron transport complex subunit D [Bacteroidales bacterium]|nr:RnfABCDGE type electron transport complex subunit D [Bacteroidales bacterium]